MLTASKDHLKNYFHGEIQYRVPFFQRAYVWTEDNWESLWENVFQVYAGALENRQKEHFIGTLIVKQVPSTKLGENWHDLIDGQQRLTTISILFKSLLDSCKGTLPNLKNKIGELITFKNARDEQLFRIELCRNDMPRYRALIKGDTADILTHNENHIIKAYDYFKKKAKDLRDDEIDILIKVILERVPVISMLLAPEDDEQVIFDTINSLGVKLTTAELLKNYIFKDRTLEELFDTFWEPVFESDEETVAFWNKEKTSGRFIRTNIEVLLYCYLINETKKEVRLDRLYKEYKDWLQNQTIEQKMLFLNNLKECANIYANFPEGEELNEIGYAETEKRFFHIIENLSITTAYPLILYVYKEVKDQKDRILILELLESYLVRRNICRLTTKNYNNLFISIIQKLDESRKEGKSINVDLLKTILYSFTEDTGVFPENTNFELAFHESQLSNQNAREILYSIALFQIKTPLHDVCKLSLQSFSVEHMMPVKWQENWMIPDVNENKKAIRNKTIKTLGNFTLVTKRLNSKLSNNPWGKKKETLKEYSTLNMTVKYIDKPEWNEESINDRANDLFNDSVIKMWGKD